MDKFYWIFGNKVNVGDFLESVEDIFSTKNIINFYKDSLEIKAQIGTVDAFSEENRVFIFHGFLPSISKIQKTDFFVFNSEFDKDYAFYKKYKKEFKLVGFKEDLNEADAISYLEQNIKDVKIEKELLDLCVRKIINKNKTIKIDRLRLLLNKINNLFYKNKKSVEEKDIFFILKESFYKETFLNAFLDSDLNQCIELVNKEGFNYLKEINYLMYYFKKILNGQSADSDRYDRDYVIELLNISGIVLDNIKYSESKSFIKSSLTYLCLFLFGRIKNVDFEYFKYQDVINYG